MSTHTHFSFRAALVASAAAVAATIPAAHSQMYRWVDGQGSVMYSNQLPTDLSVVKDLTVVLDSPAAGAAADKRATESPQAADHRALPPSASSDTRRPTVGEVIDDLGRSGASPRAASPRITASPGATEAVRDPCLRSADPKCIERNKAAYLPGHGYAGGTAAIGATSSAGGSGTLGGGGPPSAPVKITPPKASQYALPPGSELPPVKSSAKH